MENISFKISKCFYRSTVCNPTPKKKKDKRYELKYIKMLLQIDSKYYPKIEKKDSLQKNPYNHQKIPLVMLQKIHPLHPHKKMGDKNLNPLV